MSITSDSRAVSLAIPAKPEYLVLVRLALSAVCRLTSLGADDVADLKLAITEAATGRVEPDEPGAGESPTLSCEFKLDDDRLEMSLSGGTDSVVEPDEQELSRAIIEATVDECDYTDESVRLVKYLHPSGQ